MKHSTVCWISLAEILFGSCFDSSYNSLSKRKKNFFESVKNITT